MLNQKLSGSIGVALAIAIVMTLGSAAHADTVDVTIQGFAFNPTPLTVNAGTSVRWTNLDTAPHTSTSDVAVWDSGTLNQGESWTFTFNDPGEFPYHCDIHPSMTASITVEAAPVPGLGDLGLMLLIVTMIGGAILVARRKWALA